MADLAALDQLCEWMRANGATSARLGDVSLTLGAPIASPVTTEQPPQPESAEDTARRDLDTLLWSSGTDPDVFLGRRGRAA